MYSILFRVQPARTEPPGLVDAITVREPFAARETRVDEEESRLCVELEGEKPNPMKEPATATVPIRLKSTLGTSAPAEVMRNIVGKMIRVVIKTR